MKKWKVESDGDVEECDKINDVERNDLALSLSVLFQPPSACLALKLKFQNGKWLLVIAIAEH